MAVSLASQVNSLRVVQTKGEPKVLRRAGIVNTVAEGELLQQQIAAALRTLEIVTNDERVRTYVERVLQASA